MNVHLQKLALITLGALALAGPAAAEVITFDDLGLGAPHAFTVGQTPIAVGSGYTLQRSSIEYGTSGTIIDPNATGNSYNSGGRTGFEYVMTGSEVVNLVTILKRADAGVFSLAGFDYHGWNNNFSPSIFIEGVKAGGGVVSQTFALTNTFQQPWHTATVLDQFTDLVEVRFGSASNRVMAIDNINLSHAAAVPEPATWAMMLLGFGGIGAAVRRRRAVAFA